ncbi:ac75 [Sucra jujuba nucleopolyhedrovirus]|uniref:Ac75 n=1 Tax=Sucra jujuba nucleopolyhedrovirus TaxID=1563660 RepID=A0A097P904_9ABAC|nr:ac75 [Sucra jujuba nucleopolyhedrovirus]AIU41303.1 ac75 [Sucra jujuba nucleopolyhedrovirus]
MATMEFFKNFINNIAHTMPHVTKVVYVSGCIKKYLAEMSENDKFGSKFINILRLFMDKKITLDDMCNILKACDMDLTASQINYFCNQVYLNSYLTECIENYIDRQHLNDSEIDYISEFLVVEVNKAIING